MWLIWCVRGFFSVFNENCVKNVNWMIVYIAQLTDSTWMKREKKKTKFGRLDVDICACASEWACMDAVCFCVK